jgi:hypothetical protein
MSARLDRVQFLTEVPVPPMVAEMDDPRLFMSLAIPVDSVDSPAGLAIEAMRVVMYFGRNVLVTR